MARLKLKELRELTPYCPVAADIERRSRDVSVVRWSIGVALLAYRAVPAMAQSSIQTAFNYDFQEEAAAPPAPGAPAHEPTAEPAPAAEASAPCDCASESSSSCGCEASCGCESGCCSSCGCDNGWGNCLGDCCLGDAWTLQSCLHPCCDSPTYGGWISAGYYNNAERLSEGNADELSANDDPNEFGFDQVWFYTEKLAEADGCCADFGYRFDMYYGRQGHVAQSFGNSGGTWDVTWDHGQYEWAIPQLYGQVAMGDWSVKVGHFFTPLGYEVVPATGNFFYSHSLTWYNSEPITHTGVLGEYSANDCMKYYLGWTLGWDTGFDQLDGGSNFVGGFTREMGDNFTFTYLTTVGNLGWKSNGEFGYTHSVVAVAKLSECWEYVLASDYVDTEGAPTDDEFELEDKSVVNYLFYTLNDCWKLGGRAEWWKSNSVTGESASFYEISGGVNYHAHANLVIRPEIRYDWTPSDEAVAIDDYNQEWFGVDAVLTY